jgi:hypothetical protein
LHQLAVGVGAEFVEFALLGDRDEVVRRFEHRSGTSDDPVHRQAAELQRRSGGREGLAATHDRAGRRAAGRLTVATECRRADGERRVCTLTVCV